MENDRSLQPLGALRLRLTAWYASTFLAILLLLGAGLFVAVRRQISDQLRDSLRAATAELIRAARTREAESASAHGAVVDAVEELRIPDRSLYLLDGDGTPVKPEQAPEWTRELARRATSKGLDDEQPTGRDDALLVHAQRFRLSSGNEMIAVAAANQVELEDRYATLIATFGGAATIALLLVAAGGWLLARRSTLPAERTIAYMRRFMADAAHELRTPLAVLRSRTEIALQQSREPGAYVHALEGIEQDTQRLTRIVEDLLTLARADAGERPIERKRVYLDDIALDTATAMREIAEARGVTLSVDEFEEAVVDGDAALLGQLVMILLDNAVKFTPAGGTVRLTVSATGGRAVMSVADTGIGIPPEQIGRVFERFYRGDPARTHRTDDGSRGGAGLGLAIARWIADAHGAQITLDSSPGTGTRATVSFPSALPMGVVSSG